MRALEKGGTVSGIVRDFFTCTRYSSSMPETFDLVKEQSIGSPPSSFLSRVVHSASTDVWSPVVWEGLAVAGPCALMAVLCPVPLSVNLSATSHPNQTDF